MTSTVQGKMLGQAGQAGWPTIAVLRGCVIF